MQHELSAKRLEEQRNKFGITKMEAAKRMNLSQGTYVRYENGTRKPNYSTITMMAHVLETTAEYLTGQTDNPLCDSITLSKDNDPVIFEIVSKINDYDEKQLDRLLKYMNKISKGDWSSVPLIRNDFICDTT